MEMTIDKATAAVKQFYKMALDTNNAYPGFIKNPVAWALYRAWREADEEAEKYGTNNP